MKMKIKTLLFLFGLFISLQQLLFLFGNTTFGYLAFVGIILFLYLLIAAKKGRLFKINNGKSALSIFFTLYIVLIVISAFYFFEDDLFRWFVGLTPFVLTIPFLNISQASTQLKNATNFRRIWAGIAWGSLLVVVITLLFGIMEDNRLSYGGITASTIGRNSIVLIAFAFSQLFNRQARYKTIYFSMIALGIIALLLSSSKSSIIAFVAIFSFLFFKLKLFSLRIILLTALSITIITLTPFFDVFSENIVHSVKEGQTETFSGRIYIWENLIPLLEEKPWFGYGYNSPSLLLTTKYFDIWNGRDIIQAHSAWYQSMLNLGIVGSIILVLLIVSFYIRIKKIFALRKENYIILFSVFTFLLIRGFTEASFTNGYSLDVFLFSIIVYQLIISTRSSNNHKRTLINAK